MSTEANFSIKTATWRDLQDLHRLEHLCFEQDAWSIIDILGVLTFPGVVRLKAVVDGKMVAFIGGETRDYQQTGWIITLGVLHDYRRQGIAKALIAECEQQLESHVMRLCVRASNQAAIDLYKQVGYIQVEIWPEYYRGGEDALVLEKVKDL